jgi:hypothetical protein
MEHFNHNDSLRNAEITDSFTKGALFIDLNKVIEADLNVQVERVKYFHKGVTRSYYNLKDYSCLFLLNYFS